LPSGTFATENREVVKTLPGEQEKKRCSTALNDEATGRI